MKPITFFAALTGLVAAACLDGVIAYRNEAHRTVPIEDDSFIIAIYNADHERVAAISTTGEFYLNPKYTPKEAADIMTGSDKFDGSRNCRKLAEDNPQAAHVYCVQLIGFAVENGPRIEINTTPDGQTEFIGFTPSQQLRDFMATAAQTWVK